jgi:hypothetical protein
VAEEVEEERKMKEEGTRRMKKQQQQVKENKASGSRQTHPRLGRCSAPQRLRAR